MKFLTLLVVLVSAYQSALACTCVNAKGVSDKEHRRYLKGVKAIFYGKVLDVGDEVRDEYPYQPVKFQVLRTWKGIDTSEVILEADSGSSCEYVPSVGTTTIIYAQENRRKPGELYINYCSAGVFDDERMKREYGEGRAIEIKETKAEPEPELGFWESIWAYLLSFF